ncbi:HNH endonuclease signature motif containing protein [Cognatishimia activa]|uniref:HNH endonuclease signature motif containing protein n=1 Tax=Cognatishimia activa TaxID=1715691 RepID=UPI002231477C|nr:HNH endonuclease signature motif containing protein [Cognatishimia activa]UZD91619.1 HNH endonuclease [Cognatishimia activa]
MKYFTGISEQSIFEALSFSAKLKAQGLELHKHTKGAGAPKDHFIRHKDELHPLKAVIKQAMLREGIDPTQPGRKEFTSHNGRDWLKRTFGIEWVQIPENGLESSQEVERQIKFQQVISRPQQAQFRINVLEAWKGKCAISSCDALAALEAAHLVPVAVGGSDEIENGILLRSDLHKLFDANLVALNPTSNKVHFHSSIENNYSNLIDRSINFPKRSPAIASALKGRWQAYQNLPSH